MDSFLATMLESEDSDLEEGPEVVRHKTKIIYQNTFPYIHMEPPDALYERWGKINLDLRQTAGHMLQISVFWCPMLFRQQENHCTTAWAMEMGFLDNVSRDLSLKRLHKIEILELILNTIERCLADTDTERKAKELVLLSTSFKLQEDCLAKAVSWLEEFGPPGLSRMLLDLGPKAIRYQVLQFVFTEYARYIQVMSCSKKKMFRELSMIVNPEPWSLQKSEEMKNKGNEQFQKKKYDLAVKWYSKAIKYHSNNHLLYGNRALCFIRCEKYLKAMGDGKRAIILQKDWAKGHYRFCDALFFLGAKEKAIEANLLAQKFCSTDPEGMRDLQQQYNRFMSELLEGKGEGKPKKPETKKGSNKRPEGACGLDPTVQHGNSHKEPETETACCNVEKNADDRMDQHELSGKSRAAPYSEEPPAAPQVVKSEMEDRKTRKAAPCTPEKQAVRSKHPPAHEPQVIISRGSCKEQFCAAVLDAHTALTDQRCRNAVQAFFQALDILDSSGTKDLGINDLDKSLLIYGYATALVEIGQPEELAEAQRQFAKLSSSVDRKFQSLVHYGIGKVFLKENRFSQALEEFSNSLLMVQRHITPGKLTWPTTKVIVEETRPEYLKKQLESLIELCKFPPKPDALCRRCLCHSVEIYFTDPDFKGFIRILCCENCKVEFHISCWKKLKAVSFADKNDKDFLQDLCFTPGCSGKICQFVIFDSTGLIKCKFEASISKSKTSTKMRVKQKCTSLKKLKSKEDQKLRRKQKRMAASVTKEKTSNIKSEEVKDCKETQRASDKDYTIYRDHVLHQIYESRELFNDETHNISTMLMCLKPWMELDEAKGNVTIFKGRAEPQGLRELVDLLLEKSNRVWARLFVHGLSHSLNIKPKLHDWAQQLDSAGLNAAENFIDRYNDHLVDLDFSSLIKFSPIQDVLIEKFGIIPELFNSTGFTVTDYIRQAPSNEMRLFIWALEEHRERYPVCFAILDEYFEMDGICLVIRKSDNDNHLRSHYKGKSKNRKKKQKEPKAVIVLSGMRSGVLRDDEDDIFFEEDSLMLLDRMDPFSVPGHLREQVAEFEGQFVNSRHFKHYKRVLDNNHDPTKQSLYDYFAQILEEHGPLEASDPLLVGELENFPVEAQQKIEAAGGLEAFLQESLRFVMIENLIGLMQHAVSLQHTVVDETDSDCYFLGQAETYISEDLESRGSSHLNPAAKEFLPQFENFIPNDNNEFYGAHACLVDEDNPASALPGPCHTLPNPYTLGSLISPDFNLFLPQDTGLSGPLNVQEAECPDNPLSTSLKNCVYNSSTLTSDIKNINLCTKKGDEFVEGMKGTGNKAVSVQTLGHNDSKDDVAVNTEPYTLFEKNKGDMTLKEKNNIQFEKQIQKMKDTDESLQIKRNEELSVLEAEVEEIQQQIEITNKELSLFQQKLEEEIRKDQQEKKDNQETLKALKGDIKELEELQEGYSKQIKERNMEYQMELSHFLEKSNQYAAEKMSLEEEMNRCRDLCTKATSRSLAAQLFVLQNRREHGLRGLRKFVSERKSFLQNLTELSSRYPSRDLLSAVEAWKSCIQEAEQKIVRTEAQYEEQIELVKSGTKMCSLPPLSVPSAPAPPPVPAFLHPISNQQPVQQQLPVQHMVPHTLYGMPLYPVHMVQPTERATRTHQVPCVPATHVEAPQRHAAPAASATQGSRSSPVQQHLGVFDKIIDRLHSMFPHYSRPVLGKFIQEVRAANGASLNMLTYEEVINRVAQLILDHQENSREQITLVMGDPADSSRATSTPPPAHAWKNVPTQIRNSSKALNMEDPCIICHEDMAPEELCVLECRHSFHRDCIKSWLKEQSTCPTCREHALLPEDFPMLPGRHRRGHATSFS